MQVLFFIPQFHVFHPIFLFKKTVKEDNLFCIYLFLLFFQFYKIDLKQ